MRASRRRDVLVVGDANMDLFVYGAPPLVLEQEKLARGMELMLGGSSCITAFNLARLGAKVGFIGVLGDDLFGRYLEEKLRSAGVDLRHVRRLPSGKTGVTIWLLRGARRAGVTFEGTFKKMAARDVPSDYLEGFRHLHVGHYFLLKNLHRGAAALFRRARRLGLTTSVDPNYDPARKWDSGLRKLLKHTDVFFLNEHEAKQISGEREIRAAGRALSQWAHIVVIKRGARGAITFAPEGIIRTPAVRARATDRTGAGDSFNAGFLASFIHRRSLVDSLRAGAEAGSRAVTQFGGTAAFE